MSAEHNKSLSDKIDLPKLEELAAIDTMMLTKKFNELSKQIADGNISLPETKPENANKSQGEILLYTLHNIKEIDVISDMKRFGMNVQKSLKGPTNETGLTLAANYLLLSSRPSNFIEICKKAPQLATVTTSFEVSLQHMRRKGIVKSQNNVGKFAPGRDTNIDESKSRSWSELHGPKPGDKGRSYAEIALASKHASDMKLAQHP